MLMKAVSNLVRNQGRRRSWLTRNMSNGPDLSEAERRMLEEAKKLMILRHLRGRDIVDESVIEAMRKVPREEFVIQELVQNAYADHPLPLDDRATISQPYIVALMTQLAMPRRHHRALDIGTGSGYQAAILSELVSEVYTVELSPSLASSASDRLSRQGYDNVSVTQGNGYLGWPEHAPYDVIIVAASPPEVPPALVEQLALGGRLVIPVGTIIQRLDVIAKDHGGRVTRKKYCDVSFVRMVDEIS